jgi:hypothetical protein
VGQRRLYSRPPKGKARHLAMTHRPIFAPQWKYWLAVTALVRWAPEPSVLTRLRPRFAFSNEPWHLHGYCESPCLRQSGDGPTP